jgi:hypothetical protein
VRTAALKVTENVDAKDARIRELEAENARLRARIQELEATVARLTRPPRTAFWCARLPEAESNDVELWWSLPGTLFFLLVF